MSTNIPSILQDHVTLTVRCLDRLYLNGYLPTLQTTGQLVHFLHDHLGNPIPSPALFPPLHDRFVGSIQRFAEQHQVPIVHFVRGQRKDDIAATHRAGFTRPEGVVFIGVAQERASSFKARKVISSGGHVFFDFSRQPVAVNHYYFYIQDVEWGPAFVKVGTYLPYPVRVCLNGHEWVKQQLRREGIAFESLDNGFLSCADPDRLQATCDALGPDDVQAFFDRWMERLPWPLTPADRAAGYRHRLSIWQLEASVTHIFDRPLYGRLFFEQIIRDQLDLGRPDRVSLVFPTRLTRRTPPPPRGYRTRVITHGVAPSLHVAFKHTDLKQYFKLEHGLRGEATINDATDFGLGKGLQNLPKLREIGLQLVDKLLEVERLTQSCTLSPTAFETLQRPTIEDGQRVPALRFGDERVHALLQALLCFAHLPLGFRNRDLRPRVAALMGLDEQTYTSHRMTYDLRRLRLKGLIQRVPRSHRYLLTPFGLQAALFLTQVYLRVLRPGWATLSAAAEETPHPLRQAVDRVKAAVHKLCADAHLVPAA